MMRAGRVNGEEFLIQRIEWRQSDRGGFFSGGLMSRDVTVDFVYWGPSPALERAKPGMVLAVYGEWGEYNGRERIKIDSFTPGISGPLELLPRAAAYQELPARLAETLQKIEDDLLRGFLEWFLLAKYREKYLTSPASMIFHHAYLGGLAEHSMELAELAAFMASQFQLNRDVLIAGALLHDIGKIVELQAKPVFAYTRVGRLVGHVSIGVGLVSAAMLEWDSRNEVPSQPLSLDLRQHVLHIVASHHGSLENGAATIPATKEAIVFHHLDMIASRVKMFDRAASSDVSIDEFTRPINELDGARLWKGKPAPAPSPAGRGRDTDETVISEEASNNV